MLTGTAVTSDNGSFRAGGVRVKDADAGGSEAAEMEAALFIDCLWIALEMGKYCVPRPGARRGVYDWETEPITVSPNPENQLGLTLFVQAGKQHSLRPALTSGHLARPHVRTRRRTWRKQRRRPTKSSCVARGTAATPGTWRRPGERRLEGAWGRRARRRTSPARAAFFPPPAHLRAARRDRREWVRAAHINSESLLNRAKDLGGGGGGGGGAAADDEEESDGDSGRGVAARPAVRGRAAAAKEEEEGGGGGGGGAAAAPRPSASGEGWRGQEDWEWDGAELDDVEEADVEMQRALLEQARAARGGTARPGGGGGGGGRERGGRGGAAAAPSAGKRANGGGGCDDGNEEEEEDGGRGGLKRARLQLGGGAGAAQQPPLRKRPRSEEEEEDDAGGGGGGSAEGGGAWGPRRGWGGGGGGGGR